MRGLWLVILIAACRIPDEHFTTGGGGDASDAAIDGSGPPSDAALSAIAQRAYVKASNTNAGDMFGGSVALSADGSTLAVGAIGEASLGFGNQTDNSVANAGAVYVFSRTGMTWTQQAYIKASNAAANDRFGQSVTLSADGSTLAVGAFFESSSATGVGGDQTNTAAADSGAVYVYTRTGLTWSQQAYVKASNTGAMDLFGYYLALSGDGATLAVASFYEDSAAIGIDGNQADNTAMDAGAVYVYSRAGTTWTQQAYVKASNTNTSDRFGTSVALSGNGSTLAVGAVLEDSGATGIDGDQADNTMTESGAIYVFTRAATTWTQQAYVKASNTGTNDNFGSSVALSTDGSTLAAGASFESSGATGIGGDQADNTVANSGAGYVFIRAGTTWTQTSYVKASNTGAADFFGGALAMSDDGSTVAFGAVSEDSIATGVGGNQADNTATSAGAVYVFQ